MEFKTPNDSSYYTLETHSPFAITQNEINALNSPRILGISGHLRVKNEPHSVTLAILSILPVLDELIITCQPFINESNQDETYLQCLDLAKKYPNKIRLFYYTPEVFAVSNSHISNQNKEMQEILKHYNNHIPENSIHSIAHYYNYGLVKIRYKYYIKIDADHIYLTNKLLEFRKALLACDHLLGQKRNIFHQLIGKLFTHFYAPMSSKTSFQNFIKFCYLINKRCAFSLSGLNIGAKKYRDFSIKEQEEYFPLKEYNCLYIPINPHKHQGFQIYNGADHVIAPITANNIYKMNPNGFEELQMHHLKHILNLGIFSFHYGLKKRNILINGKEQKDFLSLNDFLTTPIKNIKKNAKFIGKSYEKRHQKHNLIYWKKRDCIEIETFLNYLIKSKNEIESYNLG
ncbi:hypothetical protein [Helicobacter anatolicus]|uniref:hypothetical protein n=1 Tax=Helicobacter anatolicus TaxID=2905874 RepID=UPI001E42CB23|nr:hypothetical protein [Helicobacter anatolicus]MCE3038035.1 hypothetical protein [Helicobacter anatolicus]